MYTYYTKTFLFIHSKSRTSITIYYVHPCKYMIWPSTFAKRTPPTYPLHKNSYQLTNLTSCNNYRERENFTARGVTHACKPASFPSFVTASKLAGKNNDWTSKDQSTWKRIVTISPYPTRSVYSWLSPKFSPEMCPSLVCREGYL